MLEYCICYQTSFQSLNRPKINVDIQRSVIARQYLLTYRVWAVVVHLLIGGVRQKLVGLVTSVAPTNMYN